MKKTISLFKMSNMRILKFDELVPMLKPDTPLYKRVLRDSDDMVVNGLLDCDSGKLEVMFTYAPWAKSNYIEFVEVV